MNEIMFIVIEVLLKNGRIHKIVSRLKDIRHEYYVYLIYEDVDLKLLDLIETLKKNLNVFGLKNYFELFIKTKK